MCGIAGYFSPDKKFTEQDLVRVTNSISHRGPDAEGFYYNADKTIGLGHRRLSILDLSTAANQPMYSHSGRYITVFNGEVYNFNDIAKELGIKARTTGDTEIILEAFAQRGVEFVHLLNGMFAIAIYDTETEELYLFRDRMGVKPICYYYDGKNLLFSSELKGLLQTNIPRTLNKTALADYLFLEYVPQQQSIFNEIQKLPNGCYMVVDKNGIKIKTYYNILDKVNNSTYYDAGKDKAEQFDALLTSSVKYRQISDVSVGAFLSGGVDSSVVVSKFQELNKIPIKSFTIGFDVKSFDESGYAKQVAELLKTDHSTAFITEKESIELAERITDYYDEPFAAPSTIPSLMVCKKAREFVTVALGGDGGDELFMGYGYYNWMNRIQTLQKYGGNVARKIAVSMFSQMGNSFKRAAQVLDFEEEAGFWMHVWSQEQYMFSEKEISALLNQPYKHTTMLNDWKQINGMDVHPYTKISLFDLKNYLPYNLLYKMDIASMANSLEVRLPFMDYRLVEFAVNLPLEYKVRDGEQKWLMKKHLEKYLPKQLIYRTKWGFPSPVGHWLLGELSPLIEKYLDSKMLDSQGIFNSKEVSRLVERFRKGEFYHYKKVWALVFFQMYYAKYISAYEN